MDKVRISMVCSHSVFGDISANLRTHTEIIRRCISEGSDYVCFPEMSLTGYAMPQSAGCTLSLSSPEVSEIVSLTEDSGICVLVGIAEDGGYITHIAAEKGSIVGIYRKTHLGEREAAVMVPGDSLPVFRTEKAVIAMQICWESHFPGITQTYALKGADIIFMPHASGLTPSKRKETWDRIIPARAYDNTLFCAACNQVGDNGFGTVFGGGALITDARGCRVAEDYSGECVLSADLDGTVLGRLRSPGYELMRDLYFLDKRRAELYLK